MAAENNSTYNIRVASVSCSNRIRDEQIEAEKELSTDPKQRNTRPGIFYLFAMYDPYCPLADIEQTDAIFPFLAMGSLAVYFALLGIVFWTTSKIAEESCVEELGQEAMERALAEQGQESMERAVAQTAFWILAVSLVVQLIPITIGFMQRKPSGILIAGLLVLFISTITNALLAWGPSVVAYDRVTRSRVFLLRWCEWIPTAGLMTLLAESVDLPKKKHPWKGALVFGLSQSLSTSMGLVFPFCDSFFTWGLSMIVAITCFLPIFPRVLVRRNALHKTPRGRTVVEREHYDRRRISYRLMLQCSIVWSS